MPEYDIILVDPIVGEISFDTIEEAASYARSIGGAELFSDKYVNGTRVDRQPVRASY